MKLKGIVGIVVPTAHTTQQICDWSVSNEEQISLVKMFSSISQPRSGISQSILSMDMSHTYIVTEHITFHA